MLKRVVPACLRSSVMLLSDEEEQAYELCPLSTERKENSHLLQHHHFGCRFVNSVGAEDRAEKQCQKKEQNDVCLSENNEHCAYIVYNQTFALRSYITEFHFPQRKKRHSNT